MDKRVAQIVQVVTLAIAAWLVFGLICSFSRLGFGVVVLAFCLNTATCWALQFQRPVLGRVYPRPGIKHYLDVICRVTGVQPPVEHNASGQDGELLLTKPDDYADGAERVKQVVRGQDDVIDIVLRRLCETVMLRQKRKDVAGNLPPLGSFLLCGKDGVGKRYLARVLAKLLFRNAGITLYECDKLAEDAVAQLLGAKGSPGHLIDSVRRQPFQVIVFERCDAAPAGLLHQLQSIMQGGSYVDPNSGRNVAFLHCVFVFTTAKCQDSLASLAAKGLADKAWHQQAIEVVSSETALDASLLTTLTEIIRCADPSDLVKAEVIAMLMQKEASAYDITLTHVDPEILASEVAHIHDSTGFGLLPDRIKKVLHQPLLAATQQERKTMALRYARRERRTVDTP